jgi:hypothetical protein
VLYIHTSRLRRKVAKDDGKRRYEQQFYPSRELEVIERPVADNGNGNMESFVGHRKKQAGAAR